MSGIAGFWVSDGNVNEEDIKDNIQRMTQMLSHRGSDDRGHWTDAEIGIGLGHQRLAILDLTAQGQQPMHSAEGRYVVSLDGMVYNFAELRRELTFLGHKFQSNSIAEVMLASFSQWGLTKAVQHFDGMFAFALWDRQERVLHLGRDRNGEKSLYYGWFKGTLLFGSELKALKAHPKFSAEISRDAITVFLRHRHIPAPYSIYNDVYKLMPGTILSWDGIKNSPQSVTYWSLREVMTTASKQQFGGSEREAVKELDKLLQDVIKKQTVADVPVGAFLSGGIDSSTVAALMQSQSSQPINTFSIGFHEDIYNEAQYAQAIAQHLGTKHTELYISVADAMAVISKLPTIYDEPFSDPSQIPIFLAAQMAKEHVGVSLMGDGGDELFVGSDYSYDWSCNFWRVIRWIPLPLRAAIANSLTKSISDVGIASKISPAKKKDLTTFADFLGASSIEHLYKRLRSRWKEPENIVINGLEPLTVYTNPEAWLESSDWMRHLLYIDLMTDIPDNNLVKVDRACMAVGLEARMPLLDRQIIEFAWRLPIPMQIRNDAGKRILRQVLYKYVPQKLLDRPKQGFGIPIHSWLRDPLRDWAEALLDANRLKEEGFFYPEAIRQEWHTHISGKGDRGFYLWDVIMFQAWLEQNR